MRWRSLSLLALLLIAGLPVARHAAAVEPGNQYFQRTWDRTDLPVSTGQAVRTWMWGPDDAALTGVLREPYVDATDGYRDVQYFDKSRMEITHPDANPNSIWYVTNGLLVVELITGELQVGDILREFYPPATVNVAGDAADPDGPTYQTFSKLLHEPPPAEGAILSQRVNRDGALTTDPSLSSQGVTATELVPETGHRVASVFWAFMNSSGVVYQDGAFSSGPLFENPYFATGFPITGAYWADVLVGGVSKLVLMQCFERRCLTYTPSNAPEWRVEAGNVGQHYYRWRRDAAGDWPSSGQNLNNTRNASDETTIDVSNVAGLTLKWSLPTTGNVSATPAVDGQYLYVPDWAGNLYKLNRETGEQVWVQNISEVTGIKGNFSRTTPVIAGYAIIVGDQGGRFYSGARMMAFNRDTGELLWMTVVDDHAGAQITAAASAFGNRLYVGVSSAEEAYAQDPNYDCCSFRGSVVAMHTVTGDVLWQTYMTPDLAGYSGNSVWGNMPVIDLKRKSIYVTTGNNYTVPQPALDCVEQHKGDPEAMRACIEAVPGGRENYFDSIVALDMETGGVRWARQVIPFDAWHLGCIGPDPENCPSPPGPDHDFGQGPMLFTVPDGQGGTRDLLGAGQKSGIFWALNPDTGEIVWETKAGPGGSLGGMQWGSATDGERIYVALANSDHVPWQLLGNGDQTGQTVTTGFWSALDPVTGEIIWQATGDPTSGSNQAALTIANGVLFAGSVDEHGSMYALNAATGETLWYFASGKHVNAGPAVVDGTVYWGSGYSGSPDSGIFTFGLP